MNEIKLYCFHANERCFFFNVICKYPTLSNLMICFLLGPYNAMVCLGDNHMAVAWHK